MMSDTPEETPVRGLGSIHADGFRLLSDVESDYWDGAEDPLAEILENVTNVSGRSDELAAIPTTWPIQYHLDARRGNVVDAFDLPALGKVLEVGAGCGAVSRTLGERCAVVDALEPVPGRAKVAALRCRDLPGVNVLVGELADVPPVPTYDLIVVIGVLEYVGNGTSDRRPYIEFLRELEVRLAPGGTLLLAIENPLGVKYLAGAPEDHTARFFDSVEDYPTRGQARTFTRRSLLGMFRQAGFNEARALASFPDYKMPQVIFDPESMLDDADLARQLPQFPSPDWTEARPRVANEARLWQTIVDAGTGIDFVNSFIVVASKDTPSEVWPRTLMSARFSGRTSTLTSIEKIWREDGELICVSEPARSDVTDDHYLIRSTRAAISSGPSLFERALKDEVSLDELVNTWSSMLESAMDNGYLPLDFTADRVTYHDGRPTRIDSGIWSNAFELDEIILRGMLRLGVELAARSVPSRWEKSKKVGDVVDLLGSSGARFDAGWVQRAIAVDVRIEMETSVRHARVLDDEAWRLELTECWVNRLQADLVDGPMGTRVTGMIAEMETLLRHSLSLPTDIGQASAEIEGLRTRAEGLENEIAEIRKSASYRTSKKMSDFAARHRVLGAPLRIIARSQKRP